MELTLADAVRWPIDPEEVRLRLSDRAITQLPAVTRRLWRTIAEQPAGSRLRRWLLTRVFTSGWAAIDDKDWDYVGAFYDPNVVVELSGEGIVFDWGTTHGWDETRRRLEQTYEVLFSDQRPFEALDFGGPFCAVRIVAKLTGESSGIAMSREITIVYEIGREGRVVRQISSSDPDELEAWLRASARTPTAQG